MDLNHTELDMQSKITISTPSHSNV